MNQNFCWTHYIFYYHNKDGKSFTPTLKYQLSLFVLNFMGDKFTVDKYKAIQSEIFHKIRVFVKLSRLFMSKYIFITFSCSNAYNICKDTFEIGKLQQFAHSETDLSFRILMQHPCLTQALFMSCRKNLKRLPPKADN